MTVKSSLPVDFTNGVLPDFIYHVDESEILASILINGVNGKNEKWDIEHRKKLFVEFMILANELNRCGFKDIFMDGSFVEEKDHPNDIDGYFDLNVRYKKDGSMAVYNKLADLKLKSSLQIWDWENRIRMPGGKKPQLKMWVLHKVELFPHSGLPSGIKDVNGVELQFPSAFRQSRNNSEPKGIVKIKL